MTSYCSLASPAYVKTLNIHPAVNSHCLPLSPAFYNPSKFTPQPSSIGPVIPDYCPVEPLELLPHQLAAGVKGAGGAGGAAGAAGAGQDQASRIASAEPVGTAGTGADRAGAAGSAAGGSAEGWCDGMSKEEMLQQVTRARSEQGRAEAMLQQTLLVLALVMAGLMGAALLKSAGRLSEFTASLIHLLAACVVCAWCWRCRGRE